MQRADRNRRSDHRDAYPCLRPCAIPPHPRHRPPRRHHPHRQPSIQPQSASAAPHDTTPRQPAQAPTKCETSPRPTARAYPRTIDKASAPDPGVARHRIQPRRMHSHAPRPGDPVSMRSRLLISNPHCSTRRHAMTTPRHQAPKPPDHHDPRSPHRTRIHPHVVP